MQEELNQAAPLDMKSYEMLYVIVTVHFIDYIKLCTRVINI